VGVQTTVWYGAYTKLKEGDKVKEGLVIDNSGGIRIDTGIKTYRCSAGHEGKEMGESFKINFSLGDISKMVNVCPICLGEALEKLNLPKLEEVPQ